MGPGKPCFAAPNQGGRRLGCFPKSRVKLRACLVNKNLSLTLVTLRPPHEGTCRTPRFVLRMPLCLSCPIRYLFMLQTTADECVSLHLVCATHQELPCEDVDTSKSRE